VVGETFLGELPAVKSGAGTGAGCCTWQVITTGRTVTTAGRQISTTGRQVNTIGRQVNRSPHGRLQWDLYQQTGLLLYLTFKNGDGPLRTKNHSF
jgi:hypothetical protein